MSRPVGPSQQTELNLRWQEDAACRTQSRDKFFPEPEDDPAPAIRVCERCPVRRACLLHALQQPEEYGIWGGFTEAQRQQMRRVMDDSQSS